MSNETADATKQATTEASDDAKAIKDKAKTDTQGASELLRQEVEKADKNTGWDETAKSAYKAELTKKLFDDNKTFEDQKIIGALVIEYVGANKAEIGISDSSAATLDTIKGKAAEAAKTDPLKGAMLNNFAGRYDELKNEVRDDGKKEGNVDTVDGISNADLSSRLQKDRKKENSDEKSKADEQAMLNAAKEVGVEAYTQLKGGKVLYDVAREKLEFMNSLKPQSERTKVTSSQVFAECANMMNRSNKEDKFSNVDPEIMAKNGQRAVPRDWNNLTSRTNLQLFSSEELAAIKAAKNPQKPAEVQTPPANKDVTPPANKEVTPPANKEVTPPANKEVTPPANKEETPPANKEVTAPATTNQTGTAESERTKMLAQKNWLLAIDETTGASPFGAIDKDNDNYLTTEEINEYRTKKTIGAQGEELHDAYLKELVARREEIEEVSNDEYFDESSGLTRADIELWTQAELSASKQKIADEKATAEKKAADDKLKADTETATVEAKKMLTDEKFFLSISGYDGVISIRDVDKYKAELSSKKSTTPAEAEVMNKELKAVDQIRAELKRRSTVIKNRKEGTEICNDDGTMRMNDSQNWKQ